VLYPDRDFSWRMVSEWDEASSLVKFFGEKERTFIQDCLRSRSSCRQLLSKSLFTTDIYLHDPGECLEDDVWRDEPQVHRAEA
jgi:hypothetical protein